MFIVMYLQVNATVNLCFLVLVLMVLRLLLMFLASLLGCWSYFCIAVFFCCLLPYKNICFTLILERHKKSGIWLWGLVSDFGITICSLYLLDFVSKHTLPITLYIEWCATCTNCKVSSCIPIYYTD